MFRAFWVIFLLGAIAVTTMWLADHPGQVSVTWHGYVIETSAAVLVGLITVIVVLTALIYRFWIYIRGVPAEISWLRGEGRRRQGYLTLSKGLVAVAAGDSDDARRQAAWAKNFIEEPSLTLLLSAQSAQLNGDKDSAQIFFSKMLGNPDTEFLGLSGLLNQAIEKGDTLQALKLARRAHQLKPNIDWVLRTVFDLASRAELWNESYDTLKKAVRKKLVGSLEARHLKAVLIHQMSKEAEASGDKTKALVLSKRAIKEDPKFIPAQIRLAHLLKSLGKKDKAVKAVEAAWTISPHPEIVRTYWLLTDASSVTLRMRAANNLASFNPKHLATKLLLANSALDAKLWSEARKNLEEIGALDEPITKSYCQMMAQLEEEVNSDMIVAREWLVRASNAGADLSWVCKDCGTVVDAWSVLCDACCGFDKIQWSYPSQITGLGAPKKCETKASSLVRPDEVLLQGVDANRTD